MFKVIVAFIVAVVFAVFGVSFIAWASGSLLMRCKSFKLRALGFRAYATSDLAKPSHVAERCPLTEDACNSCPFWTCSKYPHRKEDKKNEKQS